MFRTGELQRTDDQSGVLFHDSGLESPQSLKRDRWVPRGREGSEPARGAPPTRNESPRNDSNLLFVAWSLSVASPRAQPRTIGIKTPFPGTTPTSSRTNFSLSRLSK